MKLIEFIKSVIVLNIIFFTSLSLALSLAVPGSSQIPYYGDEFYRDLKVGSSDLDLEITLRKTLQSSHVVRDGENDLIVDSCNGVRGQCYGHNVIGYKKARLYIMTEFYVSIKGDGGRVIQDVYCNREVPTDKGLPDNSSLNVEHTWPQSRFSRQYPKDMQKSDVHHLFPVDSHANMVRGSNIFGEVSADQGDLNCPEPRFGVGSAGAADVFEPPAPHRGNVARALFYFSLRYELKIQSDEEKVLRKWHREDPVDEQEVRRNEEIFRMQNNRNPFIDFPELVDRLSDC